jgi:RNA polymerase sigma-70 factor (ECF subfamily)
MAAQVDVEDWYRRYGHSVLRRARTILGNEDDAVEVLHEIFVGLVGNPRQFDARSAPSTFLYAVTTRACLQRLRDRRNRARLFEERVAPAATDVDPRSADAGALLRGALALLADDEARAAVHYHLDGMTHAEVAEQLGCSRRHVGDLLERVAGRLHQEAS